MITKLKPKQVDRALYEHIRKFLVSNGYLPDITTFTSPAQYESAKKSYASQGKLIDLYGVGSPYSRDGISPARVTIDFVGLLQSGIGAYGVSEYVKVDDVFKKSLIGDGAYNFEYDVRIIANDRNIVREFITLITAYIGSKQYINVIELDDTISDEVILFTSGDWIDVSSVELVEYVCKFQANDIFIDNSALGSRDIAILSDVNSNLVATDDVEQGDGDGLPDDTVPVKKCTWTIIDN